MTPAPAPVAAPRRSQRERREATVARLIDATIESIAELGYTRTSVGEICRRAESSKGGLFRHFASRADLVVAAADVVAERHVREFSAAFAGRAELELADALRLMRDRHRDATNVVWFELLVAARTDAELRERLEPVTRRFHASMDELAAALPALDALDDVERHVVVALARNCFDGETITRTVAPDAVTEDRCLDVLVRLAAVVLDG